MVIMALSKTRLLWPAWLLSSIVIGLLYGGKLFTAEDRQVFMPGPLSNGHYQLTEKCELCHGDAFGGDKDNGEVLQAACINCHGKERQKPFDSHPQAKFKDPRNADRLQKIDALSCVSCHTEHRPEITHKDGVTQPRDVCYHCHQDIAEDRPTHKSMPFDSCTDSGCHNFHDNRALYTEFLIKNSGRPDTREPAKVTPREFASTLDEVADYPRDQYPLQPLDAAQADVAGPLSATIVRDWSETAHARSGVNCTACHVLGNAPESDGAAVAQWTDKPTQALCAVCHQHEVKRFGRGKHGLREAVGLPAMTPAQARLPMHKKLAHRALDCNSCHTGHRFDVRAAAVEACLGCHADDHSQAYKKSRHYGLWQAELAGTAEAGTGVSCATCHLPRISFDVSEWSSRIMVDHNQGANLSPNSKMIRSVCLQCHSLALSLDALADPALIQRNFDGPSAVQVTSMEMAVEDQQRRKNSRSDRE